MYKVYVRSFAPFKEFGGWFHGDGAKRKATTSSQVTARMTAMVAFDPSKGSIGTPTGFCDPSSHPILGRATGTVRVRKDLVVSGPSWVKFRLSASAGNPLTPSFATPLIDVHVTLLAAIQPAYLGVSGELRGDQFPSAEVFLEDASGNRRMLYSFDTLGGTLGPATHLPYDRQLQMNGMCNALSVDNRGLFV